MTGIVAIGTHVPEGRIDVLDRLEDFAMTESFVRDKTGFLRTARKAPEVETSDLCVAAFRDLEARVGRGLDDIDCLVVVTQNPDRHGIPHTSAIVHHKLGLGAKVAAFDISLACSGYVYSLSIVKAFLEANGMKTAVLITADPYSKVMDEADKNTSILFGDAATATLLGPDARWRLGPAQFGTNGAHNSAITTNADDILTMNGRAVFTFSASTVPAALRDLVEGQGLGFDEIDLVLLHQGSRYIVNAITGALGLDPAKVPFGAAETGNAVSSSIPLLLADVAPEAHRRVLISGFGAGLSWASMILFSTAQEETA